MTSWLLYALLSALSAAFVSIFGKMGLEGLDSSVATAVRGIIMAIFLVAVMVVQGRMPHICPRYLPTAGPWHASP